MKTFVLGFFLLGGMAAADAINALPLAEKKVCYDPENIILNNQVKSWLGVQADQEVKDLIKNKLTAYRMFRACASGMTYINVSIGATDALTGTSPERGYIIRLYVDEYSSAHKGFIIVWQNIAYGVSGGSTQWKNNLKTILSDQLDSFAADYAIANP